MLMRKRAWDIVREDYVRVESDGSLAEVMERLLECVKSRNGCLCVLVFEGQTLLGAVSIWDTVRFMTACLKQAGLAKDTGDGAFEELFHAACKLGVSARVVDIMDRDFAVLAPDTPLVGVMAGFVKKGRSYAVVKEGSQTLGVIMIQDVFEALAEEVQFKGQH